MAVEDEEDDCGEASSSKDLNLLSKRFPSCKFELDHCGLKVDDKKSIRKFGSCINDRFEQANGKASQYPFSTGSPRPAA